jgi:hypothetical protein
MTKEVATRRFTVLVLVAAIHALLLVVVRTSLRNPLLPPDSDSRSSVLFFTEVTPVLPEPLPVEPDIRKERMKGDIDTTVEGLPATPPDGPSAITEHPPPIDWKRAATQAASAVVDEAISREKRKCDPSDTPNSFLPRCTPPPAVEFDWAPPRAGFENGLPYVRIGDRCVVGLGFFGCALGTPPAKGDLFEGMREPDGDKSSVPEP